ncbi:permease [Aquipluma nitroreducens]|uniref:Permease n=1 Tax=Aquipluma nitroreducens TaxID=2010828 RepID=A0A5K7S8K9_9BACT|nr:MFS transporter [Aquipluma nitroreducens]BBE17898.1 permease [Aquipluma nitroreducens]
MSALQVFKKYPRIFWLANLIELFERYAWYGFYMGFGLFLVGSKETGAMGFSPVEKGTIMGTGSMLLYFLPIFTGAIADKIGYKKVLLLAFLIYASGFYMIQHFSSFEMVFISFIWICVGGAFFKPIISATISKTTTAETASIGFGIFYMMVNIGGFIGPFVAGIVLGKGWNFVFMLSIIAIAINFLITLLFFKDLKQEKVSTPLLQSIVQPFKNIFIMLINWRYTMFLLIMSLFWAAFNQLYYTFPIFVEDWVNTTTIYNGIHSIFPTFAQLIGTSSGTISAVTLSSMDSFYIIAFQIMVSAFVMRFKPLNAMMGGIFVLSIGLFLMFGFQSGWIILFGMLIFGLGEMSSSPKFTEYVGNIAPADKKALYMGSSFLAIALGHQIAGFLSGAPYEKVADKLFLLKAEVLKRGLSVPEISENFTKTDYFNEAARQMNFTQQQLTDFLWNGYHPQSIWILFSSIAIGAVVLLFLYDRFIVPKK